MPGSNCARGHRSAHVYRCKSGVSTCCDKIRCSLCEEVFPNLANYFLCVVRPCCRQMSVPGIHAPHSSGRTRQIGARGNFCTRIEHRINIVMEDIQLSFSLSMWTLVISRGADIVLAFPNDLLQHDLYDENAGVAPFPADCSIPGCRTDPDRLTVTTEPTLQPLDKPSQSLWLRED